MCSIPNRIFTPLSRTVPHEGDHFALDRCAVDLLQRGYHARGLEEVQEAVQQCPFVQLVDPIEQWFAIQAPRDTCIVVAGDLPT
jgi:hypothetical protein